MRDDRDITDYWLVWQSGMDWPEQFGNETMARDRVARLAKARIGYTVHLCKLQSVGTMMIPMNVNVDGVMATDIN